jgi:hypothetical protein
MKKIIVTPAGRKRYLEILLKNLNKCRDEFDEWIIWVNTDNKEDIDYIEELPKLYDYINLQYSEIPVDPNGSHTATICKFFKKCIDEDSVYLRLDDDVVFIEKDSIKKLFDFRIENEQYFLVFGNILNNALITNLYQQRNILTNLPPVTYNCEDENGWRSGNFAIDLHNIFLSKASENKAQDFFMDNWELSNFERCSINAISWLGKTFKTFNGEVGDAEEIWLSSDKPKELNMPNIIFGESLFSHYAFSPQRPILQKTNILERYLKL